MLGKNCTCADWPCCVSKSARHAKHPRNNACAGWSQWREWTSKSVRKPRQWQGRRWAYRNGCISKSAELEMLGKNSACAGWSCCFSKSVEHAPNTPNMENVLLIAVIVLLPLFLVYTLFFKSKKSHTHPALPPGPKGWPIFGNLPQLGAKPHHTLAALARVYGPLFRLRFGCVNVVVATNASTASLFLKAHDANFLSRPPNTGAEHIGYNYKGMIFAPYGPRWRMLRKLCNIHLFSIKALEDFQSIRRDEVVLLVQELAKGKVVNLGQEVNICVANALGREIMGRRVFTVGDEAKEFREMVVEMMRLGGVFNIGEFVPQLKWLDLQGVVTKMKKIHKRYNMFLERLIAKSAKNVSGGGVGEGKEVSLLSVLMGLKCKADVDGQGGSITDTEIKALLMDLFSAGTDTTTSTVEWAVAELIRHPDILLKAQQEIDSVAGRDRLVSDVDLPHLPYVQAIVKEALRLHPPTPLSLPHRAAEDCSVGGYHVPKDTTLLVNVWAISRDPDTWEDPLEFRPARFLPNGERPMADVRGNNFEVIPFGAGRRICAGMNMGLRMVQLLVAMLTHAFDWELASGTTVEELNMEEAYGLTLERAEPLRVSARKRLAPNAYPA